MLSTSKKSAHFRRSCATSRDLQCHILTQGGRTRTQGSSRFRRYTRLATLMYTSRRRLNPSPGFTSYSRNLQVTNKAEPVTAGYTVRFTGCTVYRLRRLSTYFRTCNLSMHLLLSCTYKLKYVLTLTDKLYMYMQVAHHLVTQKYMNIGKFYIINKLLLLYGFFTEMIGPSAV